MGGSKTKTVGGQAVSPVAQDFSSFLQNSLNQTGAFTNTMDSLLSGQSGTGFNQYMQSLQGQANAPNMVNAGTSNAINASPFNQNVARPQMQQMDLNSILGYSNQAPQSNIDFGSILNQQFNTPQGNTNIGQYQNVSRNPTNFATENVQAIQNLANINMADQANALRERFTATGGGTGRGSPAAYAEAVLRSRAPSELAAQLGQFSQAESALDLQNAALNQQGQLQTTALGLQQDASNIAAQLQAMGMEASQAQALASNMLNQQGMNISSQLQAMGLNSNQAQALASLGINQNQNAANTQLAGQQLDQNALGQMLQAMLANQQNEQFNVGTNLQGQLANQQAQQQGFNNQLNIAQLLQQQGGMDQQAQMNILGQLFNSLNQGNALGTSQAQTIQTPSTFQNIVGGVTGLVGGLGNLASGGTLGSIGSALGGLFGMGGNQQPTGNPSANIPLNWNWMNR